MHHDIRTMTFAQVKIKKNRMTSKIQIPKIESNVTCAVGALAVLTVPVMSLMHTCCEPCWSHVGE